MSSSATNKVAIREVGPASNDMTHTPPFGTEWRSMGVPPRAIRSRITVAARLRSLPRGHYAAAVIA